MSGSRSRKARLAEERRRIPAIGSEFLTNVVGYRLKARRKGLCSEPATQWQNGIESSIGTICATVCLAGLVIYPEREARAETEIYRREHDTYGGELAAGFKTDLTPGST